LEGRFDSPVGLKVFFEAVQFLELVLGFWLVVPEIRIGGEVFEFLDARGFSVNVKDTP